MHREIADLLKRSAVAWSAGELDAFMECYEDSPDTIYLSATHIVAGYAEIRAMYAQRFGEQSLGELEVNVLRIARLGTEHALVIGEYSLRSSQHHTGVCSLILHQTPHGWRISADHTSSN